MSLNLKKIYRIEFTFINDVQKYKEKRLKEFFFPKLPIEETKSIISFSNIVLFFTESVQMILSNPFI